MAWLAVNFYNLSGIYHSSHIVIRPILCIILKYVCFHVATRWFHVFSERKDQYLGPMWCFVTFVTPFTFGRG